MANARSKGRSWICTSGGSCCRYLFQQPDGTARSVDGATQAWVEAWLPGFEWVGFDPTHNTTAGERHIRVVTASVATTQQP